MFDRGSGSGDGSGRSHVLIVQALILIFPPFPHNVPGSATGCYVAYALMFPLALFRQVLEDWIGCLPLSIWL